MAKDPYKYYRVEAAELLDNLTRGVLELEKGVADPAMVASLFRLAHTLKGASQVVRQPGIAQAAHALEDILSPLRQGGPPVTRQQTSQVLGWLDQIGAQLATLDAPAPAPDGTTGTAARRATVDPLETVRVEVGGERGPDRHTKADRAGGSRAGTGGLDRPTARNSGESAR